MGSPNFFFLILAFLLYSLLIFFQFQRHKENADEVFRRSQDIANIVNSVRDFFLSLEIF